MIQQIRNHCKNKKRFISVKKAQQNNTIQRNAYTPTKKGLNIAIGFICVGVGVVTLPIPTGSIFLIMLGLGVYSCPLSLSVLFRNIKRAVWERWLLW